jgi:hypothetical protein
MFRRLLKAREARQPRWFRLNNFFLQSGRGGYKQRARVYAALADIPGNSFAGPGGFMEQRGPAKLVGRSAAAKEGDVAHRLWDVSEQLTGVRFPLESAAASALS